MARLATRRPHTTALRYLLACFCAGCAQLPEVAAVQTRGADGGSTGSSSGGSTGSSGGGTSIGSDETPATLRPAPSAALPGLTTLNGTLVDASGAPVTLHGVIWNGFEVGAMVSGFPQSSVLTGDVATAARRIYLLGFNTIRLPFSFKQLQNPTVPSAVGGPCTHASQAAIAASVTPPGQAAGRAYELPLPPSRVPGLCNDYVPADSARHRLIWLAQFLARNGFFVILADDLHNDDTAVSDPAGWAELWAELARDVAGGDASVSQHLLFDLLNEPDADALTWSQTAQTPGLGDLYLRAMDSIASVASAPLFLLQGCGQGALGTNWGDGFDTNGDDILAQGMSDPRPFFNALVGRPYAARVVLAPHVFGPDVTYNGTASAGAPLYSRLTASFGGLTKAGFCPGGGACTRFAALIGAFGSAFSQQDAEQTMSDLATYMAATAPANDGRHTAIGSWVYWTWNAGELGSLQGSDGALTWSKLTYLQNVQHLLALPNAP